MNRNNTHLLFAGIITSATLASGIASAEDHRMWREHVAKTSDTLIELESRATDPQEKVGNDSLLWREQVNLVHKHRVFLLQAAPQHHAKTSDTRLWREQVEPVSRRPTVAKISDSGKIDKS